MGKKVRHLRDENQRNILKLLDGLCIRYSRWEVWQDFIIMSAVSIANTLGGPHKESREKTYLERARKYTSHELKAISAMFAEVVMGLERCPDQDFLGELFMALELGSNWHGQFFTPYSVCKAMSAMCWSDNTEKIKNQGWISVSDPACGAGALLIAFASECRQHEINYQTSVLFTAQDIDFLAGCMCYIQISLLGCPGYVVIDNSLTHPATSYDKRGLLPVDGPQVWYTPMYFSDFWHYRRIGAKMDLIFQSAEKLSPSPLPPAVEYTADKSGQLLLF